MNSGVGTDPSIERCDDCGHFVDRECGCTCCYPFELECEEDE